MSWLTETLFPRRTDAETRAQFYADQAATEREAKETEQRIVKRLARDIADRDRRLERQAATIVDLRARIDELNAMPGDVDQLRKELAAQKRVNDRLSNQLLDACGYQGEPLTDAARKALGIGGTK